MQHKHCHLLLTCFFTPPLSYLHPSLSLPAPHPSPYLHPTPLPTSLALPPPLPLLTSAPPSPYLHPSLSLPPPLSQHDPRPTLYHQCCPPAHPYRYQTVTLWLCFRKGRVVKLVGANGQPVPTLRTGYGLLARVHLGLGAFGQRHGIKGL